MDDLSQWADDCRDQLAAHHERDAFTTFVLLAGIIGYQHAAVGLEAPNSVAQPHFSFLANYAPDWQEKFASPNPRHHGSRVAHGKRTVEPPPGTDPYFWTRADFDREATANGIVIHWANTYECGFGSTAFIALSTPRPGAQVDPSSRAILADAMVATLERILLPKAFPDLTLSNLVLSDIERRVLLWILDGKTAPEIAIILGMKPSSIENLQRRLPERFNTKGVFATAFLAFRLGLLTKV